MTWPDIIFVTLFYILFYSSLSPGRGRRRNAGQVGLRLSISKHSSNRHVAIISSVQWTCTAIETIDVHMHVYISMHACADILFCGSPFLAALFVFACFTSSADMCSAVSIGSIPTRQSMLTAHRRKAGWDKRTISFSRVWQSAAFINDQICLQCRLAVDIDEAAARPR